MKILRFFHYHFILNFSLLSRELDSFTFYFNSDIDTFYIKAENKTLSKTTSFASSIIKNIVAY